MQRAPIHKTSNLIFVAFMMLLLGGCPSDPAPQTNSNAEAPSVPGETAPEVVAANNLSIIDYQITSSRRIGRTIMEYRLRAVIQNTGTASEQGVAAKLDTTPANVTIVESNLFFGGVGGNTTKASVDTFTIQVDLTTSVNFNDLVWLITVDSPPPAGPSQAGIYMKIEGIPGEVTIDSHQEWIEISQIMEGLSISLSGAGTGGRTSGNFAFDDFIVRKQLDSSSADLRISVASGKHIAEILIDVIKSCGGNAYTQYAITLSNVIVSSLKLEVTNGLKQETVGFDYGIIQTVYTPVSKDCSLLSPLYSTQDGVRNETF